MLTNATQNLLPFTINCTCIAARVDAGAYCAHCDLLMMLDDFRCGTGVQAPLSAEDAGRTPLPELVAIIEAWDPQG